METETAIIATIPEAEAAVSTLRASLDSASAWGIPAHVTVLYPFLPPERITPEVLETVAGLVGAFPAFDVTFQRVGWFGDSVLWLAPEPSGPFRAMTAAVWQRFPETPPYGGVHREITPHLTVGHDVSKETLEEAAGTVARLLPVVAHIGAVRLMAGRPEPGAWRCVHKFPLAPA